MSTPITGIGNATTHSLATPAKDFSSSMDPSLATALAPLAIPIAEYYGPKVVESLCLASVALLGQIAPAGRLILSLGCTALSADAKITFEDLTLDMLEWFQKENGFGYISSEKLNELSKPDTTLQNGDLEIFFTITQQLERINTRFLNTEQTSDVVDWLLKCTEVSVKYWETAKGENFFTKQQNYEFLQNTEKINNMLGKILDTTRKNSQSIRQMSPNKKAIPSTQNDVKAVVALTEKLSQLKENLSALTRNMHSHDVVQRELKKQEL